MKFNNGITFIGSGNVAWHLASAFLKAGLSINKVISKTKENAELLAKYVSSPFSDKLIDIPPVSDLILICTSDSAIPGIAGELAGTDIPVAHTAASISINVFNNQSNAGVFYPFQTFTKGVRLGELDIPIFIEANSKSTFSLLEQLALIISKDVFPLKSEERKYLHIAGIMVNNFSNFFFTQAFDMLKSIKADPALLKPLIRETVNKLENLEPHDLQTGPARRGSMEIVNSHVKMLKDYPDIKDLYSLLSKSIFEYYNKKNEQP